MKDNAFKQIFNKFKKTISENRDEIIAQAIFMGLMSTYGLTMWKLGAASAWPPKHLNLKFLESNDGRQYLLLNGVLFKRNTK